MLDIVDVKDGQDLVLVDSDVMRAANVLQVQIGDLEYAPWWGVDTKQFITSHVRFQTSVVLAHYLERLAQSQINVSDSLAVAHSLYHEYVLSIGSPPGQEGLQISTGDSE